MPYLKRLYPNKKEEELRKKLLEEERRMRAKQPIPWTKSRFRSWALYRAERDKLEKKLGRSLTREEMNRIFGRSLSKAKRKN